MATILIDLTPIGPYFLAGIPRLARLDTDIPSVIFYTLDGTEPTVYSSVYLEPIGIPTDQNSVRLRAFAVSGLDTGTLDFTFSTNIYGLRDENGLIIDAYGVPDLVVDGYSVDDDNNVVVPSRRSDYLLNELEIRYSDSGPDGYGNGTLKRLGPYPIDFWQDHAVSEEPSSPNDVNVFFNPRSLYITIDGRDGYDDQAVHIINRPFGGTTDYVKYHGGKAFYNRDVPITGGFVRSFANYDTGVVVYYYFDRVECRWIKSIQQFDRTKVPQRIGDRNLSGPPLVFRWIYNRRSVLI